MLWERLSAVEKLVCTALCEGIGPKEIARECGISWGTVKGILKRCYAKCEIQGVSGERVKAIRLAVALTYDRAPCLRPTGSGFYAEIARSSRIFKRAPESLSRLRVRSKKRKASSSLSRSRRESLRTAGQIPQSELGRAAWSADPVWDPEHFNRSV